MCCRLRREGACSGSGGVVRGLPVCRRKDLKQNWPEGKGRVYKHVCIQTNKICVLFVIRHGGIVIAGRLTAAEFH